MNAQHQSCNTQTIETFLAGRLEGSEVAALEEHLESCSSCLHHLEELTAEGSWWEEARGYLKEPGASADSVVVKTSEASTGLGGVESYLAPTDDPHMLGRLGGYEVMGMVGVGGMGIVLKAFDTPLNRCVAIKVLGPQLALNGAARQRFAREAKAQAAVVHDNVMPIHAVAEANSLPYFVMPYARGPSLEKRLQ